MRRYFSARTTTKRPFLYPIRAAILETIPHEVRCRVHPTRSAGPRAVMRSRKTRSNFEATKRLAPKKQLSSSPPKNCVNELAATDRRGFRRPAFAGDELFRAIRESLATTM